MKDTDFINHQINVIAVLNQRLIQSMELSASLVKQLGPTEVDALAVDDTEILKLQQSLQRHQTAVAECFNIIKLLDKGLNENLRYDEIRNDNNNLKARIEAVLKWET